MYSSHFHGNLLAPAFPAFNQYPPPTPIYPSPPQIFYWTGYPNGPMSPTAAAYIQPLPLPPHAFHHFPPDRPTLFAEMEMEQQQQQQSQDPTTAQIIPHQPMKAIALAPAPNQLKVTTNLNFQYDDNGNIGRVDVSKALCYQSQEVANNVVTKKVLMMHQKKTPILISSPNMEQHIEQQQQQEQMQQQHFIDCNNNLSSPQISCIETQPTSTHLPPPPPQIFTPKTINPQFIHPPFLNHHHLNWNPQFQ